MDQATDWISPKQAARAIGVSESSLKRWCDQGLIQTVRTGGGHRKMLRAEVLRFVREQNHPLVFPEVLGLPPVSVGASLGLSRGKPRLVDALLAGDELLARQIIFDLYLARHSLSVIFDEVIAGAFREIGDRWACDAADVYQERRGCEICLRVLFELRKGRALPNVVGQQRAARSRGICTRLPLLMAELVLREVGFQATSLGTSIPFTSLVRAVAETRPKLFWLSVSHIRDGTDFVTDFAALSDACTAAGTALVVGGRALTEDLRQQMTYSAFGDNMQHLEGFAQTLKRSLKHSESSSRSQSRAAGKPPAKKR